LVCLPFGLEESVLWTLLSPFATPLGLLLSALIEPSNLSGCLTVLGALLDILTLVSLGLPSADSDFNFDQRSFPVHSQYGKREPLLEGMALQLMDFPLVEQQLSSPSRLMLGEAGFIVDLHIAVVEPHLPLINPGEGVGNVDFSLPDRLHLGAAELQTGLITLNDVKVPEGLSIGGDF
jgi:hypothetical protein